MLLVVWVNIHPPVFYMILVIHKMEEVMDLPKKVSLMLMLLEVLIQPTLNMKKVTNVEVDVENPEDVENLKDVENVEELEGEETNVVKNVIKCAVKNVNVRKKNAVKNVNVNALHVLEKEKEEEPTKVVENLEKEPEEPEEEEIKKAVHLSIIPPLVHNTPFHGLPDL
jgi:hypothetical protein